MTQQAKTITTTYTVSPLPTQKVEAINWGAIFERLAKHEEPVFECTVGEARSFTMWAQRNKAKPVYYKTVGKGHLQFSLKPQRANAAQAQAKAAKAAKKRRVA